MYTFVFQSNNYWEPQKSFNMSVLDEHTTKHEMFNPYQYWWQESEHDKYKRHTLHAIGRACNYETLEHAVIVEIEDDMEAMTFRLCMDNFIKDDSRLTWLIQDIDLVTPLKEGTELKWLVDHDTSRTDATKAVAEVRKYEDKFSDAMDALNGGLGDDMDEQWSAFSVIFKERLKAHHANLKPSLNKLNKERKELLKYLDKYNKK